MSTAANNSTPTILAEMQRLQIIPPDRLADFLPPRPAPVDPQDLMRDMIRRGDLTKFQAQEILNGRAKSLVLGNYVLVDRIGVGGMGQVFKAQHKRMKRVVAVKTLPKSVTKDAVALGRFQREVEAAAKLSHPNVVAAHDADEADGVHFLVMEFVDGPDLHAMLKQQGKMPVADVVKYLGQAAEGLAFAHAKGVVHRDIKPGNLLLDKDGVIKILDMGLARFDEDDDGHKAHQQELTQAGLMMGTVDYMAPEQARNLKKADAKSDVYSLGCTMYRLLTGKPPYDGETAIDKILAHRETPIPSLRAERGDVPPALDAFYARMVAKQPDRRPAMAEIAATLKSPQLLAPPPPPAPVQQQTVQQPIMRAAAVPMAAIPAAAPAPAFAMKAATLPLRSESSDTIAASTGSSTNINVGGSTITKKKTPLPPAKKINPNLLIGGAVGAVVVLGAAVWMTLGGKSEPVVPEKAVALAPKSTVPKSTAPSLPVTPPTTVASPTKPFAPPVSATAGAMFQLPPSAGTVPPAAVPSATTQGSLTQDPSTPVASAVATGPQPSMFNATGTTPLYQPVTPAVPPANLPGPPRAVAPFDTEQAKAFQKSWADYVGQSVESTNSISMKLMFVPPGSFLMGSTLEEVERYIEEGKARGWNPTHAKLVHNEDPPHLVTLTKPFLCGAHEVTIAQYKAFVDATQYVTQHERQLALPGVKILNYNKNSWRGPADSSSLGHPVANLTWYDCAEFCNWLSKQEGLKPVFVDPQQPGRLMDYNADGYRFLTEAEWEYACRAGTRSRYWFGDDENQTASYMWTHANAGTVMNPVGTKPANPWGLFDMHGNVAEWTADFHRPYGDAEVDPHVDDASETSAIRGRNMDSTGSDCRSANRRGGTNGVAQYSVGFRICRIIEPVEAKQP